MHTGTWVLPEGTFTARVMGQCLCDAVRWTYDAPFTAMLHCHCSICRKHHGTMFATFVAGPLDTFHWRRGTEHIVTWASSSQGRRSFCSRCGSKVPGVDTQSQRVFMPAGGLDGELGLRPQMRIFMGSKPAWHEVHDGLPAYEAYPPEWGAPVVLTSERPVRAGVVGGSCACGKVRYELDGKPLVMRNCHCSRCRRARGGAHATNIGYPIDALKFVAGEELVVTYKLPEAEHFSHAFCRDCGGTVPHRSPGRKAAIVPAGTLDSDPGIYPSAHQCVASKASWFEITDGIPQFPESVPLR